MGLADFYAISDYGWLKLSLTQYWIGTTVGLINIATKTPVPAPVLKMSMKLLFLPLLF